MGWFSRSEKQDQPAEPSRQNRQKCWESRDAYFGCLDRANIVKPGDEGDACTDAKKLYEENCAKSWIEYFNQRRIIADAQKDRLLQAQTQANNVKR